MITIGKIRATSVALALAFVTCAIPFSGQALAKKPTSRRAEIKTEAASPAEPQAKVDLNTASRKQLESLPGVGAVSAKKIISARPYANVSDLTRSGIPAKTIQKISPLVTVSEVNASTDGPSTTAPPSSPVGSAVDSDSASTSVKADSDKGSGKAKAATAATGKVAQTPPQKGMVWVNLDSGVYHKEGTRWYGKTKNSKFMTEADAIKAGYKSAKR